MPETAPFVGFNDGTMGNKSGPIGMLSPSSLSTFFRTFLSLLSSFFFVVMFYSRMGNDISATSVGAVSLHR